MPQISEITKNVLILKRIKKILRTLKPENFEKIRTAQPEPKFTSSYKKVCIRVKENQSTVLRTVFEV